MQTEIAVNTTTLGSKVVDLNEDLARVRSKIDKMYEAVTALDRMWDGRANAVFNQQFATDKSDFEALCTELKKVFESMETAKKEYELCEADVSQIIASIRV